MTTTELIFLIGIFLFTSIIGVVTGSNSLITVPAMLEFNFEPANAIATNMFALIFMSIGGTIPFLKGDLLNRKDLPLLSVLTVIGSILGALLVIVIPSKTMPLLISISMIAVLIFSVTNRDKGVEKIEKPSPWAEKIGYALTFGLGIYGGFFSGGYVTTLTAAFVAFLNMTFVEAVAVTKVLNIFSSLIATLIFATQGLVDYKLGIILGITMFFGAMIGAKFALKMSNLWLRRIFIVTVIILAGRNILQWLT
ncbi:sulfite exporter TauE/SafE family protein [Geminocystis sp. GBBB08]|uniref:sulfite exporter TauE/SafE family protein n=1 Tax=Geminocystis sp. GBBB08 TaxID=2604140 RepID=UPI0027E2F208|nr:sulfite exporter TauE/SafE family protein [Geminocystis sp. GBBB08]MBL1211572.1 sulfite exporter TauE/SafE family protein [Geminocystis sp. GBBB08]